MIVTETKLQGAFLIEPQCFADERGFFARMWSQRELEDLNLNGNFIEYDISFNKEKGTLRGMHFQSPPHSQIKLVRCTMGEIQDVIIDLRRDSPTFKQWLGVKLSAENRLMLYIPEGFAHGFQTLQPATEVSYQMSSPYVLESSSGVRWNDPAFAVKWPLSVSVIAQRDNSYSDYA